MKIRCEYLNGTTREFSDELHVKVLCRMLKEAKNEKGMMYNKIVDSPLSKIWEANPFVWVIEFERVEVE